MIIDVKVKPNANKSEIRRRDGFLEVFLRSSPECGKANMELLKILGKEFNHPKIVSGFKSRRKKISVIE